MILIEDGKCTICGNRDNVVALNDHDSNRTVLIICKDCLIDSLINFGMYGNVKQLLFTPDNRDVIKLDNQVSKMIFDAIESKKHLYDN